MYVYRIWKCVYSDTLLIINHLQSVIIFYYFSNTFLSVFITHRFIGQIEHLEKRVKKLEGGRFEMESFVV